MKIKLAILGAEQNSLGRIVSSFNAKYPDKFEIYSFTVLETALEIIESKRIDVFLAEDSFSVDASKLPKKCGFAWLCDTPSIESYKDYPAICRFQKIDLIYRQILSIYSEQASEVTGRFSDDHSSVLLFASPCGGVGTSSMAAACAKHYAMAGKKVIYLNIEECGFSDLFFQAEGQFGMSDIIYAIKGKKSNIALKMESCVRQDASGVQYFAKSAEALDMTELTTEDIHNLISELRVAGAFDYIIVDAMFSLSRDFTEILKDAQAWVMVSDGSEVANEKIKRACSAFSIMEKSGNQEILMKAGLIYNKFSNKASASIDGLNIGMIGGSNRFENATTTQVVDHLAGNAMFDTILE